jgi:hypothetical protein
MKPRASALRICNAEPENPDKQVTEDQLSRDQTAKARPRSGRARQLAGILLSVGALAAAYVSYPRHADLTQFDAAAMGRLESSMWRDYYEKRYVDLFRALYDVSRNEYGFSPLDSVQIAIAAARAAKTFQPSTSRAAAEAALPFLNSYFSILSEAAKTPIAVEDAARTELAWWQARREAVPPEQYGAIIARVATLVYGVEGEDVRQFGALRAQAMAYRDARDTDLNEADWVLITKRLELAYALLKKAVAPNS